MLLEHKAREHVVLQERIAKVEAISILLTKRVSSFKKGDLVRLMKLLADHKEAFPWEMQIRLTTRMLELKFEEFLEVDKDTLILFQFSCVSVSVTLYLGP